MRDALAAGVLAFVIVASVVTAGSAAVGACVTPTPSATSAEIAVQIPEETPTPMPTPTCMAEATTPPVAGGGTGSGGRRGPDLLTMNDTTPVGPAGAPLVGPAPSETDNRLELDHDRISSGDWMVAIGHGFTPGEQVQLVLYSEPVVVDSYVADAGGSFTARFRIPEKTRSGIHTLEATGWQSESIANAEFVVVTTAIATGGFPQTWWLFIVLGILLIALIASLFSFRRSIAAWLAPTAVPGGSSS